MFVKRKCFAKIKDGENKNHAKNILKKYCKIKIDDDNKKLLGNKLKEWKDKIPLMKKLDAFVKIQNNFMETKDK